MKTTVPGPTYREMLHPESLRACAGELDPANLFNITWRGPGREIRHIVLPRELTGVRANIVVLVGRHFPSGSHKVGPAYTTLMEGELSGEIDPSVNTVIGPSTGNFGIGTAYVSRLKGYPAIVIMPEGMSKERYARIRQYSGALDLTPGSESDVILVLERTEHYKKDPKNKVLAQFELLPNYRFHRYVTGRSVLEAGEGLWIKPCEAVHTFFMNFPIDLVYLDQQHRIRKVRKSVPAWRLSACLSASSVLELPSGCIEATQSRRGDKLEFSSNAGLSADGALCEHA